MKVIKHKINGWDSIRVNKLGEVVHGCFSNHTMGTLYEWNETFRCYMTVTGEYSQLFECYVDCKYLV